MNRSCVSLLPEEAIHNFWLCLINFRTVDWNKFSKLIVKLTFTSAVNYENNFNQSAEVWLCWTTSAYAVVRRLIY
ncbi:MAG: hypothetical protein ACTS5A_00890 [Candidatus Hodgkinia cicadicola]